MAVELDFANVIVKKVAVERAFPGGLDGFAASSLPNFVEDEHLVRVGFMSTREAFVLLSELQSAGVRDDEAAIVNVRDEVFPAWLHVGHVDRTACCWMRDADPGPLARADASVILVLSRRAREALERCLEPFGLGLHEVLDVADGRHLKRDDAELLLHILENVPSKAFILLVTRSVARRREAARDAALMRDLIEAFRSVGATGHTT